MAPLAWSVLDWFRSRKLCSWLCGVSWRREGPLGAMEDMDVMEAATILGVSMHAREEDVQKAFRRCVRSRVGCERWLCRVTCWVGCHGWFRARERASGRRRARP